MSTTWGVAVAAGRPASVAAAAETESSAVVAPSDSGASRVRNGAIAMAAKRAMRKNASTWEHRVVAVRIVRSVGLLPPLLDAHSSRSIPQYTKLIRVVRLLPSPDRGALVTKQERHSTVPVELRSSSHPNLSRDR